MHIDYIDGYLNDLAQTIAALSRESLQEVVEVLMDARMRDSTVFVMGNGGSAATASHMGNDLNKLTMVDGEHRFRTMALTDNVPLMTAWGNDADFDDIFVEQLKHFARPDDVVIGISTSGNSGNVVKAFTYAQEIGATTVLFGGETGGKCGACSDYQVLTPSGHQGIQEDCHLIFNHVIAWAIKTALEQPLKTLPLAGD